MWSIGSVNVVKITHDITPSVLLGMTEFCGVASLCEHSIGARAVNTELSW